MKPEDITEKQIEQLKADDYVNFSDLTEHLRECAAAIGRDNFEVAVENRWHTVPSKLKEFRLDTTYRLRQDYEKPVVVKVELPEGFDAIKVESDLRSEFLFSLFHPASQQIFKDVGIDNFHVRMTEGREWNQAGGSFNQHAHYRLKPHITLEFTEPHGCPSCSTLLVKIDELEKQLKYKCQDIKSLQSVLKNRDEPTTDTIELDIVGGKVAGIRLRKDSTELQRSSEEPTYIKYNHDADDYPNCTIEECNVEDDF